MKESTYKHYLLGVLMIILAFNAVDRLALGLLLQEIKVDLSLSDTQLGFLNGLAFALFYSIMGIPIARWADRGNRVTIISITTALWSAAVSLCGLVGSFTHLLLIRVGVAVGEAGCVPPAHSMIADFFTRAERPRAVGIYKLGASLSAVIGYFLAGWLNELYGWRMAFILLGLPGLILAPLAWFTLREPRKQALALPREQRPDVQHPTLRQVCGTLLTNRTFCHLLLCYSVSSFFTFGIAQWQPTFFIRSYGLQTGELGTWFAVIYGIGGVFGTYLGGELATRRAAFNEPLQLNTMAVVYVIFSAVSTLIYLSPSRYVAFGLMAVATVGGAATIAPMFAMIQTLVPDRMRAVALALIYLFANLIGMGLGPLAAGALSDAYHSWAGAESLRYALLTLCPGYLWGAWHLWRGARSVSRDLRLQMEPT